MPGRYPATALLFFQVRVHKRTAVAYSDYLLLFRSTFAGFHIPPVLLYAVQSDAGGIILCEQKGGLPLVAFAFIVDAPRTIAIGQSSVPVVLPCLCSDLYMVQATPLHTDRSLRHLYDFRAVSSLGSRRTVMGH